MNDPKDLGRVIVNELIKALRIEQLTTLLISLLKRLGGK